MRYTDYKQVRLLAGAILTEDKRMIALVEGLRGTLNQLSAAFRDDGYDAVTAYANGLLQSLSGIQEDFLVLAQELLEYADLLESVKGTRKSTPGSSGYSSPYQKTSFSGTAAYTDPNTKQPVSRLSNRTVYENSNIDPATVVPAGTKRPNGKPVRHDITNLELMEQGEAPFIYVTDADGTARLAQVELHHLSGQETRTGSAYFTGTEKDGTLVEIASSVHDKYDRQLHIGNPSFRRDGDGKKTEDAVKYEKFRSEYWKHRAQKFKSEQN